jgi:hypothetical protein
MDSPLEEPGFEPLVPLCRVVVSGWNRNAGIGEEDDLEGVVCRGDRVLESLVSSFRKTPAHRRLARRAEFPARSLAAERAPCLGRLGRSRRDAGSRSPT